MNRSLAPTIPLNTDDCPAPSDGEAALRQTEALASLVQRELREAPSGGTPRKAEEPSPVHSEEESLQSYLDQFMERLTGKKNEPAPSPRPEPAETLASFPVPFQTPAEDLPEPRELARPPECREQLSAMRELANENARSAVALRVSLNLLHKTRRAFQIAAAISICSSALAVVAIVTSAPGMLLAAVATSVVTLVPTGCFLVASRQLARSTQIQDVL